MLIKEMRYMKVENDWILKNSKIVKEFIVEFHKMTKSFPTVEQIYARFDVEEKSENFGCVVILLYDNTLMFIQ